MDVAEQGSSAAKRPFIKKYAYTILALAILALLVYGWASRVPSIFGDEWGYLFKHIKLGGNPCPDWNSARPFGICWTGLAFHVANMNMIVFHAFGMIINFITSLLLLITLDILLPDWPSFNGAVAAVYLLFPADMTRVWLAGSVTFGAGTYLLPALFMALFWRDGRWWSWLMGMITLFFALGSYEVGVGAVLALSGMAFLFSRHRTWGQRVGLLFPAIATTVFSLWRWSWQKSVGSAYGYDVNSVTTSPLVLAERLYRSTRFLLGEAWVVSITELQPFLPPFSRSIRIIALALIIGSMVTAILLARRLSKKSSRFNSSPAAGIQGMDEKLKLLKAGAVGLVIMFMAYFPIILVNNPNPRYPLSRVYHLPAIGASLVICATLFGVCQLMEHSPKRARLMALAGLIPLLAVGIAGHVMTSHAVSRAWADQKFIWNSILEQANQLEDGTRVLLLLDGNAERSRDPHPFISGIWGFTSALNLLYENDTLYGTFIMGSPSKTLDIDGDDLIYLQNGKPYRLPAAKTLVFVFNKEGRELYRSKELKMNGEVLSLGEGQIIVTSTTGTKWRWLVAD